MISFELSQEQALAQSMVRDLAGSALRPAARDADDREAIPQSILDEIWASGIIQSNADPDPEARSATLNAILLEELAAADASFAIAAAAPVGFLCAVAAQGSPAQKERSAAAVFRREVSMRRRRDHGARFQLRRYRDQHHRH